MWNLRWKVAAAFAKKEFVLKKHNVDIKDIGAFFITPCPAKMTSIKSPLRSEKSHVDGAISMLDIYARLASSLKASENKKGSFDIASAYGVGWANSGGESLSLGVDGYLSVDGVHNIIPVLEEIENERLTDLDFFEGLACTGGCIGGPLVFENGFVARNRLRLLLENLPKENPNKEQIAEICQRQSGAVQRRDILAARHAPGRRRGGSHEKNGAHGNGAQAFARPGLRLLRRAHLQDAGGRYRAGRSQGA